MAGITINGVLHDWESVTVVGPQGLMIGINEISFSSKQEKKNRYGRGGTPRGVGRSNYEPEAGMVLDTDEWGRMQLSLGMKFYRKKFPIVITITPPDAIPEVTILKDCMINGVEDSMKQGDDNITKKLSLRVGMINRNGVDEYE